MRHRRREKKRKEKNNNDKKRKNNNCQNSRQCTCTHRQVQSLHWTAIWVGGKTNAQQCTLMHTLSKSVNTELMWLLFFSHLLFLYPCPQFQPHSNSNCLQDVSYFYCSFRCPPLNISKWLCECRAFHCVCWLLTFIAVQHLFMHFISESRTLPLLHHNLLWRPEPTWVVLYPPPRSSPSSS